MSAAFTPGPWFATPYRGALGYQVWAGEPGPNAVLILEEGDVDKEADARLIAAAPAMFEALELFVVHLERQNGSTWGLDADEINRLDRGKAALRFNVWWDCIPAYAVGADHERDRVWAIATHDHETRLSRGLQARADSPDAREVGKRVGLALARAPQVSREHGPLRPLMGGRAHGGSQSDGPNCRPRKRRSPANPSTPGQRLHGRQDRREARSMTVIATLSASAEAYLVCGDELSASMCTRMIQDVRSMDEIFGEGAGDALHRHWASQLAERAAVKLAEHNEKRRAA